MLFRSHGRHSVSVYGRRTVPARIVWIGRGSNAGCDCNTERLSVDLLHGTATASDARKSTARKRPALNPGPACALPVTP